MNLLKQFAWFNKRRELVPLTANEIALYFILLDKANRQLFPEWLPLCFPPMQEEIGLTRWAMERARDGLISKGYIKYRAGNRGKKPSCQILILYETESSYGELTQSPTSNQHQSNTISTLSQHQTDINSTLTQHQTGDTNFIKQQTATEKEKPPKGGKKKKPEPEIPNDLSPELQEALARWLAYKAERRENYKPTGWNAFVSRVRNLLEEYPEQAVVDVIASSMANNWVGVAWDKLWKGGGRNGVYQKQSAAGTDSNECPVSNRI
jgi:hypothetical protein